MWHRIHPAVPRLVVAAVLGFVLFAGVATTAAHASQPQAADYTVASVAFNETGGAAAVFNYFEGRLCLVPPYVFPYPVVICDYNADFSLLFAPLAVSGSTVWAQASSEDFATFTQALTNGVPDWFEWEISNPAGGGSALPATELTHFGDQVGLSGIDLAGYTIDRIGFRVDQASFTSPGENPNGNGIWTDYSLHGAFVFEGTISSKQACMAGGWRSLHGPDGTHFDNQGACIRLAETGR